MSRVVWSSILILFTVTMTVRAQNVNLTGKVSNSSGQPVAGAIVTLVGLNIKDTTDATGAGVRGVYTIGNGGGYGGFYCFAHKP